jgi:hypothetical protein
VPNDDNYVSYKDDINTKNSIEIKKQREREGKKREKPREPKRRLKSHLLKDQHQTKNALAL